MTDYLSPRVLQRVQEAVPQRQLLVAQLADLGFYQYTPVDRVVQAQAHTIQTGELFTPVPERMLGQPDSEDIDEGQAATFVQQALPILALRGIMVTHIEEDWRPADPRLHTLTLNGELYVLFRAAGTGEPPVLGPTTINLHAIFDELLAAVGSPDRVYYTWPYHDDVHWVLLTPAMHAVLEPSTCLVDWWEYWWRDEDENV